MSIHPALIAPFMAQAPRDFDLDFRNGIYRRNGLIIPSLTGVAGISHPQSGSCWEVAPDGSLVAFAANEPRVVPGLGLWARGILTNLFRRSDAFDIPSFGWVQQGGVSVAGNAATDPLGGSAADTVAFSTNISSGIYDNSGSSVTAAGTYTESVWAKQITVGATFDLGFYNAAQGTNRSTKVTSAAWQRFSTSFSISQSSAFYVLNSTAAAKTAAFWGATLYSGPLRGPIILTNGTQASNGASVMTIPFVPRDEDFVILVGFNMKDGNVNTTHELLSINDGTTNNRIRLGLVSMNSLYLEIRSEAALLLFSGIAGGHIYGAERGVVALRRRSGKYTLSEVYGAAAPKIGVESGNIPMPGGLTSLNIGHDRGVAQLNGVVERVRILPGTFDDAALANLITDMAA